MKTLPTKQELELSILSFKKHIEDMELLKAHLYPETTYNRLVNNIFEKGTMRWDTFEAIKNYVQQTGKDLKDVSLAHLTELCQNPKYSYRIQQSLQSTFSVLKRWILEDIKDLKEYSKPSYRKTF